MDRKDPKSPQYKVKKSNHWKLIFMTIFLGIDLALNATLDYDQYSQAGGNNTLVLGLLGLQLIIQLIIFLILFLTIADTFLFRVGLLNILVRKIRITLLVQLIYFALTIAEGTLRYNHYSAKHDLLSLMKRRPFVGASFAQKAGTNITPNKAIFILRLFALWEQWR